MKSFLFYLLLLPGLLFAESDSQRRMKNYYKFFKSGEYQKAIDSLTKLYGNIEFEAKLHYLKGLAYKKLQEYEESNHQFRLALNKGRRSEDIFFEYAQSLYAINELELAYKYFDMSLKRKYKAAESLYYMAYIAELLDAHKSTKKNYLEIIRANKNVTDEIKQVAYLQIATLIDKLTDTKFPYYRRQYAQKYIVPLLQRGYDVDPDSVLAVDIKKKMQEVQLKNDIYPFKLRNGRIVPEKDYLINFNFNYENDSNVTLANEQTTTTATEKSSNYYNASLFMNKRWIFKRRYVTTPEVIINKTAYQSDDAEVTANDTQFLGLALRNTFEHFFTKKQASFLFDVEWNRIEQDINQTGSLEYFGTTTSFVFGERVRFTEKGDTTFKIRLKDFSSYTENSSFDAFQISIDQLYILDENKVLVFLYLYDSTTVVQEVNSTKYHLFRVDFLWQKFWKTFNMSAGINYRLVDTMAQSATRGTEKEIIPYLRFNYDYSKNILVGLRIETTDYSSLDPNQTYKKTVYGLEVQTRF